MKATKQTTIKTFLELRENHGQEVTCGKVSIVGWQLIRNDGADDEEVVATRWDDDTVVITKDDPWRRAIEAEAEMKQMTVRWQL